MDEDNPASHAQTSHQVGADISSYSVEELEGLIVQLEEEKLRVQNEMARKKADLDQANALFS